MIAARKICLGVAATLSASLMAGCASVGPDYTPPVPPAGLADRVDTRFEASDSAAVSATPLPANWWRLYNDARLNGLVEQALAANTDLRVAAANLELARASAQEVRAAAGVQATVSGGPSVTETSSQGVAPAAGGHPLFDAGIGISYEIDVVGRIRRALEAADASTGVQMAAYDLARTTVVADVVGAYTSACATGAQLEVAKRSLDLQRQSLALTRRGMRGGVISPLAEAQSSTLVAQLAAALPPLEANRRVSLYRLAVLTGNAPQDFPPELAGCATIPELDRPIPVGDGAQLIARRPDIRAAERQLAAATARIGVATAGLYPSVSVGGSLGTTSQSVDKLVDPSAFRFSLGPLISWTFPNTSVARARIAQADATAQGALASFDGTVLNALREAESTLTVYVRDLEENARLREARDESRRAADIMDRLARGGTASGLQALDVKRTLASAESALAASDARLAADRVSIFLALGGGWEDSA